jgi:uncharacterized protein with PIN domain
MWQTSVLATWLTSQAAPSATECLRRTRTGTLAKTLIVAGRRNIGPEAARLLDELGLEVVPVTLAAAPRVAEAYDAWGKGIDPAGLNFGDCFAYSVAKNTAVRCFMLGTIGYRQSSGDGQATRHSPVRYLKDIQKISRGLPAAGV